MDKNLVAKASVVVNATVDRVWDALVDPQAIKQYMFGADVTSDWNVGSPITWTGEWQGRRYDDKGKVLQVTPEKTLQYSHFSPLSGQPDKPENYHTVTINVAGNGGHTRVSLFQDNNQTEEAREHSEKNWQMMLAALKKYLET